MPKIDTTATTEVVDVQDVPNTLPAVQDSAPIQNFAPGVSGEFLPGTTIELPKLELRQNIGDLANAEIGKTGDLIFNHTTPIGSLAKAIVVHIRNRFKERVLYGTTGQIFECKADVAAAGFTLNDVDNLSDVIFLLQKPENLTLPEVEDMMFDIEILGKQYALCKTVVGGNQQAKLVKPLTTLLTLGCAKRPGKDGQPLGLSSLHVILCPEKQTSKTHNSVFASWKIRVNEAPSQELKDAVADIVSAFGM